MKVVSSVHLKRKKVDKSISQFIGDEKQIKKVRIKKLKQQILKETRHGRK